MPICWKIVRRMSSTLTGSVVGADALLVGRADDLARLDAAAGEQHALGHRPVIAAGRRC